MGAPLNAENSFPIAVLILMALMFIAPIITRGYDKRTLAIQYVLMMAIILMELSYILLFGY
ncbi:hypothetical protein BN938_1089 [Mucinivorans hirudinis]|uniref:Uncharacterized protein n=1 Tax=Mucinivorans hirudinis TaxID=1433126 RepID=A0A060R7H0_9BACT|nr:hypothetical protein BN938_1089 [Mucinivorans hirudinis]